MMDYRTLVDINKAMAVAKAIKRSDLVGREFTKKEFDKICRGIASLDWVRKHAIHYGRVERLCWDKYATPMIEISRIEKFEMKYKPNQKKRDKKVVVLTKSNTVLPKVDVSKFESNLVYRETIIDLIGDCKVETIESNTFTAKRNFYKINMDAFSSLEDVTIDLKKHLETKYLKAQKLADNYRRKLNSLG